MTPFLQTGTQLTKRAAEAAAQAMTGSLCAAAPRAETASGQTGNESREARQRAPDLVSWCESRGLLKSDS